MQTLAAALVFVVQGSPQPKERPRIGKRGHVYTPHRTSSYEQTVRVHALRAVASSGWRREPGARYAVTLGVYFPDEKRRDLDNACKAVLDGCNGTAFADDSEVHEVHMVRAVDRERPRVEVRVSRLGTGGTDSALDEVVRELGTDERKVLLVLARRLLAGQGCYGRLDLAKDARDWRNERAQELADALVYGAIAEVAEVARCRVPKGSVDRTDV